MHAFIITLSRKWFERHKYQRCTHSIWNGYIVPIPNPRYAVLRTYKYMYIYIYTALRGRSSYTCVIEADLTEGTPPCVTDQMELSICRVAGAAGVSPMGPQVHIYVYIYRHICIFTYIYIFIPVYIYIYICGPPYGALGIRKGGPSPIWRPTYYALAIASASFPLGSPRGSPGGLLKSCSSGSAVVAVGHNHRRPLFSPNEGVLVRHFTHKFNFSLGNISESLFRFLNLAQFPISKFHRISNMPLNRVTQQG